MPVESCWAVDVARLGRAEIVGVGGREDEEDEELCEDLEDFDEDEVDCHAELLVSDGVQLIVLVSSRQEEANGGRMNVWTLERLSKCAMADGVLYPRRLTGTWKGDERRISGLEGSGEYNEMLSMRCSSESVLND